MKKIISILLICIMLLTISFIPNINSKNVYKKLLNYETFEYIPGTYLITSEWGQWGLYNNMCPWNNCSTDTDDHFQTRLGCWSVAIGQIINYHSSYYPDSLQSTGVAIYEFEPDCMEPHHIVNNLDDFDYDWSQMANILDGSSSPSERTNVQQLLYDTATVIQKNFSGGSYCTKPLADDCVQLIAELNEHFPAVSSPSTYWDEDLTILEIKEEIDHDRPIMFYMDSPSSYAHAVVLDGYEIDLTKPPMVHLNYGWDGTNNGWYPYSGPFPNDTHPHAYDNPNFRKGLLIRLNPLISNFKGDPSIQIVDNDCFFMVSCDYDADPPIHYLFDWDDESSNRWLGPFQLGVPCTISHSWNLPGIYDVKVKAKNNLNSQSDWIESIKIYITEYESAIPLLEFLLNIKDQYPIFDTYISIIIELICSKWY